MIPGIRFAETRRHLAFAFALAAFVCCLAFGASRATAAEPAVFEVGAASSSINPDSPQYVGGYGYKQGPTQTTHDNLEARAFVVGKGKDALAFVSVDLVGWFAAYDGEQAPYGIDATREKIADALNSRGYDIGRESVIVSSTHVHAAPTVVGIWGTLDGEYLKKVSDAAVTAASRPPTPPGRPRSGPGSVTSVRSSGKTVRAPITLTVSSTTTPCRSSGPVIPTPARRMPSTPTSRTTRTSTRWTTTTSRCRPTGPATPGASSMP